MSESSKKYLAIDYGTKRIGTALNFAWLAEPYKIIPRENAEKTILQIIEAEYVDTVVIGIADGRMADEARAFVSALQKAKPNLAMIEVDESLSSVETHVKLAKSGMKKSKRERDIDHYAAAAILQDYLDMTRAGQTESL